MWGADLKPQRSLKTGTDACRSRDIWVTHFVPLQNVNKIALAFTSKEIAIYDLSSKLEFSCQFKVQGLNYTPLCLDYWYSPNNVNDATLVWGDVGGFVNILFFNSVSIALFERPPAPPGEKQEPCLNIQLKDIASGKYKNATFAKYEAHNENNKGEWVRGVQYSHYLECFISCATTTSNAMVIGWMVKHTSISPNVKAVKGGQQQKKEIQKKSEFNISQGINAFSYSETLNLIATAGVNNHVCLWNPYVTSKPNGVLRGHMACVTQVQFMTVRNQLISFSKDKVLRIWDVQLQVCIQRLAGMFPKGPEVTSVLLFDDSKDRNGQERNRLFTTFGQQITVMEMKVEVKDRVCSHEKPVVAAIYNSLYNQVVSLCQGGTIIMWLADTGQKVKQFNNAHGNSEVTCLTQDQTETRLYTGSTDGTVKVWDFNGHCYHMLECAGGQPADVSQVLVLKRSLVAVGWAKTLAIFRNSAFKEFHVQPADWKGGQEHAEDILCCAFSGPTTLATGSYDGEVIIWNTNSEHASRHCAQRSRRGLKSRGRTFVKSPLLEENTLMERSISNLPELRKKSTFGPADRLKPPSSLGRRSVTRLSISPGGTEEHNEFGWAVVRLIFLENRQGHSASGAANLVSCGGNGWVRFWNSAKAFLVAEFVAHQNVGGIIMATDAKNRYIATADVDGFVKVWEIQEYALGHVTETVTEPPPMKSLFQPHQDQINTLEMFERNERLLIISASSDCSVALWDIYGNRIGIFGQEEHWKIEPYHPKQETDEKEKNEKNGEEKHVQVVESNLDPDWVPDAAAITEPAKYRVNTWGTTVLGKDYQELRKQKRERRQPGTIPDLPYLHWEKTGAAPSGPYSALDTKELNPIQVIVKPDPEKYFIQRTDNSSKKLPLLADTLITAFDEKSLFPSYILEYERRMKSEHSAMLNKSQSKGKIVHASLPNFALGGGPTKTPMSARKQVTSGGSVKVKLKPITASRSSSLSTSYVGE
ncbi:WD repeat-containing protein 49-like isoform X2 [Physella acuta]|nr:WD repeat-containing protein 49-like isoform X2 [Physella acuta]